MTAAETDSTFTIHNSTFLRVIPLGGLGEFGMNMMVYETESAAIVVDCGMMFPDASTLGVDAIVPDMSYVYERAGKLAGIFLTHGHEDHIGAVPFLLEQAPAPVFGSPLTLGFVADKLEEFGMREGAELRTLTPRQPVTAGPFTVEPIHVTHSIVDSLALAIATPAGTIIHTGDFKLDQSPVDHEPTDLARFASYGEAGVALLVSDSTNAAIDGYCRSESIVSGGLDRIFSRAPGRVIVTTFASHIHRIQQIVDQAVRHHRKVFVIGRSMVDNIETAERLGHLRIPREARPDSGQSPDDKPRQTVVITTGTQGEPSSALARLSVGEHKMLELNDSDTVVISARTIPGNERAVSHVLDHLCRRGAEVIYDEVPDVHVSGHACQEELRTMINLTRPRFFIPMHGSFRHLTAHAKVARSVGVAKENIFVITNGQVLEISGKTGAVRTETVPSGKVFIDQQAEEVAGIVVRDRKHLAEDGFVIIVMALASQSGQLLREPEIITRGVIHVDASSEILEEVRRLLNEYFAEESLERIGDAEVVQDQVRARLKRYFRKKLNRRPMILPVVWEM